MGHMTAQARSHCRLQATDMAQQEVASSGALALVWRWRQQMAMELGATPSQVLVHPSPQASRMGVCLALGRVARRAAAHASR